MSISHTRSKIRNRFWIPKDTPIIKTVLKKCKICFDQRGQRYHVPDSPDFPAFKFDVNNPWKTVYIDMTGHFFIKDKYNNAEKVYFIVFVCASTGSGHIEIAIDASAEAFANSFQRFCSFHGVPDKIISDHGSNFKAYDNQLKLINATKENSFLVDKEIEWVFCPIGDPHFNGFCERHLGILKSIMRKAVKNRLLTLDQLITVGSYAQAVFNERPLCVLDNSDPNIVPLTPNSLVYGRNLPQFVHGSGSSDEADPDYGITKKSCTVMHNKLRNTLAAVHKTWISEYLAFLSRKDSNRQKNSPFTKSIIVPKVNDYVLIKENSKDLRIGKITELFKSDDGEVRKVMLRTDKYEGIYPITNLRFLEGHPKSPDEVDQEIIPDLEVRPKRQAAEMAKDKIKQMSE